jgi:ADP-ribosylglycohydrolase
MPNSPIHGERFTRALQSLRGLNCGDAFGERFFVHPELAQSLIAQRAVPSPPWRYTDDTIMAIAIAETLEEFGEIRERHLAESFGRLYLVDPPRGYGPAMHKMLPELATVPSRWKEISEALFNGTGSFGNGSAMRVAPLGAYFADDLDKVVEQAEYSSVVTHSHPEAVAGAIAVASAAALAWQHEAAHLSPMEFLQKIIQLTPMSEVHLGIKRALNLPPDSTVADATRALGNGARVSCQDTVPFCLWAAAQYLDDYQGALWTTVSGLGDRDTTCAIVGGIVAMSAGMAKIPPAWLQSCEPIPAWFLYHPPAGN